MKAMGATDSAILRIFLYQGAIIGFMGAGLGLLLGLLVCKGLLVYGFPLDPKVYFISRLPVQVRPMEFLITGEIALAICLEATILPSLYAANLSPADGFRDQSGDGGSGRSMSWGLTLWLLVIHGVNVIGALLVAIQLETGGDLLVPRVWLVALGVGFAFGAVAALAVCLWRRWGFYGLCALFALHSLAILPWAVRRPIDFVSMAVAAVLLGLTRVALQGYWRRLT
jgi:lipoprotein-releasing system permease protein